MCKVSSWTASWTVSSETALWAYSEAIPWTAFAYVNWHVLRQARNVSTEMGIYKRKKEDLKTCFFFLIEIFSFLVEILFSFSFFLVEILFSFFFLDKDLVFFSFFLESYFFLGQKRVFFLSFLKSFFYKFPPLPVWTMLDISAKQKWKHVYQGILCNPRVTTSNLPKKGLMYVCSEQRHTQSGVKTRSKDLKSCEKNLRAMVLLSV